MTKKIRTAVIGVGHLGQHHARILKSAEKSELVAVVDANDARAAEFGAKYECQGLTNYHDLAGKVDAVSIAVPTSQHYSVASWFLEQGIHTLVEKPICQSIDEAERLVALAKAKGAVLQIGHIERFNPALRQIKSQIEGVAFIEAHRLSPYPFRSMDIGVIMDVMIHDLDIILSLVNSRPAAIHANATALLSKCHEDIASARVEFESGAVANITASRVSDKVARKMRVFCRNKYVNIDFAAKKALIYKKSPRMEAPDFDITTIDASKLTNPMHFVFNDLIRIEQVEINEVEPLRAELEHFLDCVDAGGAPEVSGQDGLNAIRLASDILTATRLHQERYGVTL